MRHTSKDLANSIYKPLSDEALKTSRITPAFARKIETARNLLRSPANFSLGDISRKSGLPFDWVVELDLEERTPAQKPKPIKKAAKKKSTK